MSSVAMAGHVHGEMSAVVTKLTCRAVFASFSEARLRTPSRSAEP